MKYSVICLLILFIACATTTKYVVIKSYPPGATIEVNDSYIGRAPTTFWIKGSRQSSGAYSIRAIPSDISNEIIFVQRLMTLREIVKINDIKDEYAKKFGEPQNVNTELIEHILSYLVINKGKATTDELLNAYIDTFSPQYTQSKFLFPDDIFGWQQDTLFLHFKMTLEPIPERYEIELR